MNLDLTNKNAFIGGSSKGIGWATAIELANMGANCTLISRDKNQLAQRIKELPNNGNQTHDYFELDYANVDNVNATIIAIKKIKKYQILVNNTGGPTGGNIIDESVEKFEQVFRQHLVINQLLAQAFLADMKESNFGRIVNIISVSVKQPIIGLGVSNTVRWAVASWAKTLSKEIAINGITVNNVLPGYTLTDRLEQVNQMRAEALGVSKQEIENQLTANVPIGRFATAEEVASAVAFLCSPAAASINGVNLPVDGGLSSSL
jgi:3-oxoacyl-[acyl-carrier protein] reductase